jgi:hypothetical protein
MDFGVVEAVAGKAVPHSIAAAVARKRRRAKVFSSEVETGSREENASVQRPGVFSRFEEKRKYSRLPDIAVIRTSRIA